MQVKKIMIKNVISVKPDDKVTEVAKLLTKNRIHAVPVVEEGMVIGIITESDFFLKSISDVYIPSYIDFLKKSKFHKLPIKQKLKLKRLFNAKAKDIMTKKCLTVEPETDIKKLLQIFKTKKYFTLPVINKSRKLVGIITQADIINLIKL